jgi:hypothetical protein
MTDSSVFSKLIADNLEKRQAEPVVTVPNGPRLRPVVPPTDKNSPPLEKLLDWLVNRWPKPTVFSRDILLYGPNPLRNRKAARASAEILVERGWLTPLKTRRYIDREWKIERGPRSE